MYAHIEPYRTGMLRVSDVHTLYFEECGNPHGRPVVFLHGGPGAGCEESDRRFFDPGAYRIVLYDQRGAGRSTPYACIDDNTTPALVADLETLRVHLGIERWQVFGGSWGVALALAYAEAHVDRVSALVLRGVFLATKDELDWLYAGQVAALYPDEWERFASFVPASRELVPAYLEQLTSADESIVREATHAWNTFELALCTLVPDPMLIARYRRNLALARLEAHYALHAHTPDLLGLIGVVRHVPCVIVHGRHDMICPLRTAHRLHRAWPEAELVIVEGAGHSAYEPGISKALVAATDRFRP